jgi:hypothetical protein
MTMYTPDGDQERLKHIVIKIMKDENNVAFKTVVIRTY